MTLKLGAFDWNKYALVTTGFFIVAMVLRAVRLTPIPLLPYCPSATSQSPGCPVWFVELRAAFQSFMFIIGGMAGLKAAKSFGGRRNFTGRLLFYFSLLLFALGPFYQLSVYLDSMPNPFSSWLSFNVFLPYSGLDFWESNLAYFLPSYALVISLRSVWNRYDMKSWLIIILSVVFALVFGSWFSLATDASQGLTTLMDAVLFVGIGPLLLFVQLAAAGLLLHNLGRWYVARSIRALVVSYLVLGLVAQTIFWDIIFGPVLGFGTNSATSSNLDVPFFYWGFVLLITFYLFCMVLTQIKPRTKGPFF